MQQQFAILIEEETRTNRLKYLLDWLFVEQLNCRYQVFSNHTSWYSAAGFKINYTEHANTKAGLWIKPHGLLQDQKKIGVQRLNIQRWKHTMVLFYNQPGAKVPFDIFSAIFYFLSRYEEYLPFAPDQHGRFSEQSSVAFQYKFLSEPVVDQWVYHFKNLLENEGVTLPKRRFQCRFTFDIDMAWKYKNRGILRYWGGHLRDLSRLNFSAIFERRAVIQFKKEDPYFSFPFLKKILSKQKEKPVFFCLIGDSAKYDRNTSGHHPEMKSLIRNLQKWGEIAIHPSYHSYQRPEIIEEEIALLSSITCENVRRSRQHFIRFSLPDTYRTLHQSGIREDYSMGFAGYNGFRAGTSLPFFWYDLENETITDLRIFPFAFMDATGKFYKKQKPEEVLKEWKKLYLKIRAFDGHFISIWHNYILSSGSDWQNHFQEAVSFSEQPSENI